CVGRPHSRYYARSALTFITDTAHYMLYTLYLHAALPILELLRKVGRLVAEEEAAHCVLLVEEVARPKLDADPAEVAADLEVHERSEEHTSELQSRENLVCRLLLEKINKIR